MYGFWSKEAPPGQLAGCPDARLTSYVRKGQLALLTLASWDRPSVVGPSIHECALKVDWGSLGLESDQSELYAPSLSTWQDFKPFELHNQEQPGRISVPLEQGLVLVLARRSTTLASLRARLQQKQHDFGKVQYRQVTKQDNRRAMLVKLLQAIKRGEKCTKDRASPSDGGRDDSSSDVTWTCS